MKFDYSNTSLIVMYNNIIGLQNTKLQFYYD